MKVPAKIQKRPHILGELVFPDLRNFRMTTRGVVDLSKTFTLAEVMASKSLANYIAKGYLEVVSFWKGQPQKPSPAAKLRKSSESTVSRDVVEKALRRGGRK